MLVLKTNSFEIIETKIWFSIKLVSEASFQHFNVILVYCSQKLRLHSALCNRSPEILKENQSRQIELIQRKLLRFHEFFMRLNLSLFISRLAQKK